MPKVLPARTTLVLVGLLCSSFPLLAKETAKAEVPSDMPAELSLSEKERDKREPARVGPSLTDEPNALSKDLVPSDTAATRPESKTAVRLLDSPGSPLDAPAEPPDEEVKERPASAATAATVNPDAADGKTEEDRLAEERLQEMQNDQEKAQAETKAEEEAKGRAETQADDEAKAQAEAKVDTESAKADAQAAKANRKGGRKPSEEGDSTLAASSRIDKYQSPRNFGLDLQFSSLRYPNLGLSTAPQGGGGRLLFEWMFYQGAGKFAVSVGAQFSSVPTTTDSTGQSIKVNTVGAEGTLVYRADYVPHQLFVPFVKGGMDFDYVVMSRSGGSTASQGGYKGVLIGGGLEFNLYIFEKRNATLLDRKFGINETFLVFEYVKSSAAKAGGPNLAHDELRFGLRFEI